MNALDRARVWDPLYGRMDLSPLEYSLVTTPEVQRLRYIRMCNINSMLVTGASEISRFEHSLGVLRLTHEWIHANANFVSNSDAISLQAAALLHDIQTGPFGHSFQYILEDNDIKGDFSHDDLVHGKQATYYQDLPVNASFAGKPFLSKELLDRHWHIVASIIRGEGPYGKLISGSIDLDNIDNVIRLAYHVGLASSGDSEIAIGIAKALRPNAETLAISSTAIPLITRWQEIRHRLYEFLLLDWAEFSAKAMLTNAMELAVQHGLVGSDSWILTDDELFFYLEQEAIGESQDVADVIKKLRRGELNYPIGLFRSFSTSAYWELSAIRNKRDLESRLAIYSKTKLKFRTRYIVHYILDQKKTDRAVEVVTAETGTRKIIGNDSHALLIGVFSSAAPPNSNVHSSIAQEAMRLLNEFGIPGLETIPDPLGRRSTVHAIEQLSLL